MNNKGVALPLIIILVTLFVVAPVLYFFVINRSPSNKDVKGASSMGRNVYENGVGFYVTSKYGTWDSVLYFCETKDECEGALDSGKRGGSISGGTSENFLVRIAPSTEWDVASYLKIYLRSAWGSPERDFRLELTLDPDVDAQRMEFEEDGRIYEVLLVELAGFREKFSNIAVFSD